MGSPSLRPTGTPSAKVLPDLTARAPRTTSGGVKKLIEPSSSSFPHRPQFFGMSRKTSRMCFASAGIWVSSLENRWFPSAPRMVTRFKAGRKPRKGVTSNILGTTDVSKGVERRGAGLRLSRFPGNGNRGGKTVHEPEDEIVGPDHRYCSARRRRLQDGCCGLVPLGPLEKRADSGAGVARTGRAARGHGP